jgi:hypothetical protein
MNAAANQDSESCWSIWSAVRPVVYTLLTPLAVVSLLVRFPPLGGWAVVFAIVIVDPTPLQDSSGTERDLDALEGASLTEPQHKALQRVRIALGAAAATRDKKERRDWLCAMLDRVQAHIDGEYGNIAARTGWLLAGQAFLVSAFVSILNSEQLPDATRRWLAAGVALSGAVISGVLSLSTYLGARACKKCQTGARRSGESAARGIPHGALGRADARACAR